MKNVLRSSDVNGLGLLDINVLMNLGTRKKGIFFYSINVPIHSQFKFKMCS